MGRGSLSMGAFETTSGSDLKSMKLSNPSGFQAADLGFLDGSEYENCSVATQ